MTASSSGPRPDPPTDPGIASGNDRARIAPRLGAYDGDNGSHDGSRRRACPHATTPKDLSVSHTTAASPPGGIMPRYRPQ